ncbi:hypothetical protein GE061_011116 [Apolygus lucorum]|uniref:Uncharacterized protein n=1 Tax=Apolygus lucorum TaxID=248454 RepID=A0A6A4K863_APOLU|nr:hypothetical protein GE061_011116 [Apolygus lucorum]
MISSLIFIDPVLSPHGDGELISRSVMRLGQARYVFSDNKTQMTSLFRILKFGLRGVYKFWGKERLISSIGCEGTWLSNMKHEVLLIVTLLGIVSQVSSVKKRLFFGDYGSSESSESSNSTESDEWLDSLLSVFGPLSTTTKRPAAGTKIPIATTTLRPPIIKCSEKPTEPCPADCLTDSAIIHGFCCNCKNPTDSKVKPSYLCPASTACPSNTTKLCDLFSRLMTCCCKDAFAPKPSPTPPSKPDQRPPLPDKPLPSRPTPPMIPSPTTSQKPSSTDAWPTPPTTTSRTSTTPVPSTTTTAPQTSSQTTSPAPATTSVATLTTTSSPSPSTTTSASSSTTSSPTSQNTSVANPMPTPPTSSATSPAPLPTPPTAPTPGDSPSSSKSQQSHIVVDIDSASVQDEEVDLPFETMARRVPRRLRHARDA